MSNISKPLKKALPKSKKKAFIPKIKKKGFTQNQKERLSLCLFAGFHYFYKTHFSVVFY